MPEGLIQKQFLSLRQFAEIIGISYPTALKYKKDERICTVQVGKREMIPVGEVSRFMTEGNLKKG